MVLAARQSRIRRQVTGRAFSEPATIINGGGAYDDTGRWQPGAETRTDIRCATAPPERSDPRVRELTEGGVQLDALRRFFTIDDLQPASNETTSGDFIEYEGERWRVDRTGRWGGLSDSLAVRVEDQ